MPPKGLLVPKCRLKRRVTEYYCYLILRKITKSVATRCHISRLKCTKLNFGWGSAPYPAGGVYSAPPDPLGGFKGAYFEGKGGKNWGMRGEREGEERRENGKEGRGRE